MCGLNVHKRCERMVPCNCGIKQKDLAAALKEMNILPDKLKPRQSVSSELNCPPLLCSYLTKLGYLHVCSAV